MTEKDFNLIRDYIDNPDVDISDDIKTAYYECEHKLQKLTIDRIEIGDYINYRGTLFTIVAISDNFIGLRDENGKTEAMGKVEYLHRKKLEIFEKTEEELGILELDTRKFFIPKSRLSLLIITNRLPRKADYGVHYVIGMFESYKIKYKPEEPSVIYPFLPISEPQKTKMVEKLNRKPSYKYLTPEQRWIYLSWLKDITQPIDINYVFLYYYGLERHLIHYVKDIPIINEDEHKKHVEHFIPNLEIAINEIAELRKFHQNNEFQHFSMHSVFYTLFTHKRLKDFWRFFVDSTNNNVRNINLIMAIYSNSEITPSALTSLIESLRHRDYYYGREPILDSKYIFQRTDEFKHAVEIVLERLYGVKYYPINKFSIQDIPLTGVDIFANYSLEKKQRIQRIPNITNYTPFLTEIRKITAEADEIVKNQLRKRKKHEI